MPLFKVIIQKQTPRGKDVLDFQKVVVVEATSHIDAEGYVTRETSFTDGCEGIVRTERCNSRAFLVRA